MQNELIAFNETSMESGGKLIWSPGQETLSFLYFELEISHKQIFISVQEGEYI